MEVIIMDKLDKILDEIQEIKSTLKTISDNQLTTSDLLKNDSTSEHYNQNEDQIKGKL